MRVLQEAAYRIDLNDIDFLRRHLLVAGYESLAQPYRLSKAGGFRALIELASFSLVDPPPVLAWPLH